MRGKRKTAIIIILSAALAISLVFNAIFIYRELRAPPENAGEISGMEDGEIAPDFSVELLAGGDFTLSEHRGKVVFLTFWATWCPPCIAEMPAIQELSEKYGSDVVFIGVNIAEDTRRVQDFINREGYTYNIGLDKTGYLITELYPTDGIPYTLIIDANGFIVNEFLGGGAHMHNIFENAIIDALKR